MRCWKALRGWLRTGFTLSPGVSIIDVIRETESNDGDDRYWDSDIDNFRDYGGRQ